LPAPRLLKIYLRFLIRCEDAKNHVTNYSSVPQKACSLLLGDIDMKTQFKWMSLAIANAALISLAGCGGGGGDAAPTGSTPTDTSPTVVVTTPTVVVTTPTVVVTPPAPTTTAVTTTVIDGALKNATVCMDKNTNGVCDAGEVQGKTDAAGNVTLAVPNADVGKFPLLAMVGTDAVDADNGTVTVAYTLSAPASKPALISPLTHLVQEAIASTGVTVAEAESAVQSSTGINVSLFQDFTKVPAPTDGSPSAKVVARMAVVTTQAQVSNLASTVSTPAIDSAPITQADINRAINQRLLQILPALVAALSDPTNATLTTAAKEAAVVAALSGSLLTTASMPTLVGINNQQTSNASAGTSTGTVTAAPPTAGFVQLSNLIYTNATNWFTRAFTSSLAQNTPDASNKARFVDRKYRSNNGVIAQWNFGNNPQDQANLHWTGSAWEACGLNFESTSTVRDAAGNSTSNYCNNYNTTKSNRTSFDISGKSMKQVYDQARAAGYTNLSITNSDTLLGTTTFPAGSELGYQTTTPQTVPQAYSPGTSSYVYNYSAAIAAGGDSRTQAAGVGCNASEYTQFANASNRTATLESMVSLFKGTPCIYGPGRLTANGVTYESGELEIAWGNSTLIIGTVGSVNFNGVPTAFYTGNTPIRLAFTGTGTNPVTYYACKQRFVNGGNRNCTAIGTGNYTITTLGDARVMTLSNPPALAAPFTFTRTFVERGGQVYYGYQDKLTVSNAARLNTTASNALLAQLGLPAVNPEVPLALTAASYQGTWVVGTTSGAIFNLGANGTNTCNDLATGAAFNCTFSITNPATGAFSGMATTTGNILAGTLDFTTGQGTLTYSLPAPGGSAVIVRR
jgi:trimeric autotransporter adhesin